MSASGLHGKPRIRSTDEMIRQKREREASRITEYDQLVIAMHTSRMNKDFTIESLQRTESILKINPEFYTAWNCRREILIQIYTINRDEKQDLLQKEIRLTDILLKSSPKTYWLWNHRRWALENCPTPLWERELKLLEFMLDQDGRNFHGWDYRRYVIQASKISSPLKEFEYTTKKIAQNFSNFSAWHYRSKLLPVAFTDPDEYEKQLTKGCIY